MKITPLVAAMVAALTLGACSAAPVGPESTSTAPSFELSNTASGTTTSTTCQTLTTSSTTTTTTDTTVSTTQFSASGTYAVAYGSTLVLSCS